MRAEFVKDRLGSSFFETKGRYEGARGKDSGITGGNDQREGTE